jgi:predicted dehydrogenase
MSGEVRVGIVGTGWWPEFMYLPSLGSHPGARIAAICGRNVGRAAELAGKVAGARVFGDHRALFDWGEVDAVVVATADDSHAPITLAALDAGLHVLCEKPMANRVADARAMLERAEAAGVAHMVLFTWRWQPHWIHIRRLIGDGFVGRPHYAGLSFISNGALHRSYQWRMDGNRATGALGDMASHMFDFTRWMFGEPHGLGARVGQAIDRRPYGGDPAPTTDTATINLALEDGTLVHVYVGMAVPWGDGVVGLRLDVHGDDGTIEAQQVFLGSSAGVRVRGVKRDEPDFHDLATPPELLGGSDPADVISPYLAGSTGPRHFVDAILAGERPVPSFRDGLRAQEMIEATLRSSAEGRWIVFS